MPRSDDGAIRAVAGMEVGPLVGAVNKAIGSLSAFAKKLGVVGTALSLLGLMAGFQVAKHLIKGAKEVKNYQLQLAELAKVLDGLGEASVVAHQIGELSKVMPSARSELFNVAETAARLGIRGTKNIRDFTEVAAMMGVATNISAEQAADSFARILKQSNTPISQFKALGSAVNELANNMATSTAEIVENMRRTTPEFARLGLTAGEIAALSATVNEVSESATRAGTRLRRFAQSIADPNKLTVFARALKMNAQSLNDMFQEDPVGSIMQIVKAFKDGGEAADVLASNLDSRVRQVLAQLAQNYKGLEFALATQAEQMQSASSLTREYALFTDTLAAKQQLARNKVEELWKEIGLRLVPALEALLRMKLGLLDFWAGIFEDPLDDFADDRSVDKFREQIREAMADVIEFNNERRKTVPTQLVKRTTPQEQFGGLTGNQYIGELGKMNNEVQGWMQKLEKTIVGGLENIPAGSNLAFAMILGGFQEFRAGLKEASSGTNEELKNYFSQYQSNTTEFIETFNGLMQIVTQPGFEASLSFVQTRMLEWLSLLQNKQVTLNDLIPAMQAFQILAVKTGIDLTAAGEDLGKFTDAADQLIGTLQQQKNEAQLGRYEAMRLSEAYTNANKTQKDLIDELIEWLIENEKLIEQHRIREQQEEEAAKRREENIRQFGELGQQLGDRLRLTKALNPEEKKQVERSIELRDTLKGLNFIQRMIIRNLLEFIWEAEDAAEAADALAKAQKKAADEAERWDKKIADLKLQSIASQFRLMETVIEGMADSMVDAFEAIITGSGNAGEAVAQMIKDIARELLKHQIMGFLFSLAQKHGVGPFGSIGTQTTTIQGTGTYVGGMAKGGNIRKGQFAMVGEEGPEMFVPKVSGTVLPNSTSIVPPQEIQITNHYTIQALDGSSVRQILTREQKTIAGLAMDTINRHRSLKRSN